MNQSCVWDTLFRLILPCLFLHGGSVFAATVNMETCANEPAFKCITSIENIQVLGVFYDLTVENGTFDDLFPNPETDLSYWGDSGWANAAMSSVITELNALNPVPSVDDTLFVDNLFAGGFLHLPFEFSESSEASLFNSWCVHLPNAGNVGGGNCIRWDTTTDTLAFPTFALATSVPTPPALWLFGSGLLGLIGISRRKKPV